MNILFHEPFFMDEPHLTAPHDIFFILHFFMSHFCEEAHIHLFLGHLHVAPC
jgi:hypothetical protein